MALIPGTASAAGLAYIQAGSQLADQSGQGRYHPINLLDNDPASVWCAGTDDKASSTIQLMFKAPLKVDRIVITPAVEGRVVDSIRVTDGTRVVTLELGNTPVAQELRVPLVGRNFEITLGRLGPQRSEGGEAGKVACLADVLFYSRNNLFGNPPSARIRYDAQLARLLGSWNGAPLGAPEKSLAFALDGTWEWTYKPLLGGKAKRASGEFRFRGKRLLMRLGEAGRWTDMGFKLTRVRVDKDEIGAPAGDYDLIVLGPALGDDFTGEYNNARF